MNNFSPIYYADIHTVNNKGCLVTGCGKTKVFKHHIPGSKEIALDSIRITCSGDKLIGYEDALMGFVPFDPQSCRNHTIDYLIFMSDRHNTTPQEISKNDFVNLSLANIAVNDHDDGSIFTEYIKNANVKCYLIPRYKTVEEKAKTIINLIV